MSEVRLFPLFYIHAIDVRDCGIDMCIFLCERMGSMLGVDHNKSNSSLPWQLEECQDSISIVYSILSRFSHFLLDKDTSQMIKCVALVSKTMFWILQVKLIFMSSHVNE